jgi:hypothetical protein
MYGYGDSRNPAEETVNVAEELVCDYIAGVAAKAAHNSKLHNKPGAAAKFRLEDILVSLRKYPKKYARVKVSPAKLAPRAVPTLILNLVVHAPPLPCFSVDWVVLSGLGVSWSIGCFLVDWVGDLGVSWWIGLVTWVFRGGLGVSW